MTESLPATQTAPGAGNAASELAAVERAIREADPAAFPVPARIVRRVIRDATETPALNPRVPHRKSLVAAATMVRPIVRNDELGLDPDAALPETLILLARPEEHELERMTFAGLCEHLRRLHFHSRIHLALDERRAHGELDDRTIATRIEAIGYTAFDEIRTVLRDEAFLLPPVSVASVYVEFAAVFLELRYFAADVLVSYFPSLDDFDRIEAILGQDVDVDSILRMTADLAVDEPGPGSRRVVNRQGRRRVPLIRTGRPGKRGVERLLRDAAHAAARGNDVRAAILHTRAAGCGDPHLAERAANTAAQDVRRLTRRLAAALDLEPRVSEAWRELLSALLANSAHGFWNPDARLLYDLQKVCLDFERETYVIDLAAWLRSLGRGPIKRPLPAQREVRMSKHLRGAARRLAKSHVSAGQREHLAILLREAVLAAERRLRGRLRPALEQTLIEVGFLPQNLPERVSFGKIVEELLDGVVERGFFGMGDLRDAIARNNLKLDDVADPLELVTGDRLLRADRGLARALDGVYQRGAFYLRQLQAVSSCGFGTRWGRFVTLYIAIPFGGAYVLLAFLEHLAHEVERLTGLTPAATHAGVAEIAGETAVLDVGASAMGGTSEAAHAHLVHLTRPWLILAVGVLLLGLIHDARLRRLAWLCLRGIGTAVRVLLVELPLWLAEITLLNRLLRSPAVVFLRKRLLTSVLLTAFFCWLLPAAGSYRHPPPETAAAAFVIFAILLNSRAGRDLEELAAERLQLLWHRLRVRVFVALFDLVMDSFKHVLEWLERILYEVDEWLRFKSGETGLTLGVKAGLGLVWSVARFFISFLVTVLIEPQINPIKHFPVVTVSHKIIFPMQLELAKYLVPVFGAGLAYTIAAATVLLLPGVFGFLVWEMRGNWRLYAVNRHSRLRPVIVGEHGETLLRLMKLGVHSGTLPRLFARLRRAARGADPSRRLRDLMGYYLRLHHVETSVRRFFEREFSAFLTESRAFAGTSFEIGAIDVGTNSLRVEIRAPALSGDPAWLAFEEQAGRILVGVRHPGWMRSLAPEQSAVLAGLLVGLYRVCGADLIHEQILACLGPQAPPYDISDMGLTLLPGPGRPTAIIYNLDECSEIVPHTAKGAGAETVSPVNAESLVFGCTKTPWNVWVAAWESEEAAKPFPNLLPLDAHPSCLIPII